MQQAARDRAIAANRASIELIGGDGAVSSSRDDERGSLLTSHTCGCAAGRGGDPICPNCSGGGAVWGRRWRGDGGQGRLRGWAICHCEEPEMTTARGIAVAFGD